MGEAERGGRLFDGRKPLVGSGANERLQDELVFLSGLNLGAGGVARQHDGLRSSAEPDGYTRGRHVGEQVERFAAGADGRDIFAVLRAQDVQAAGGFGISGCWEVGIGKGWRASWGVNGGGIGRGQERIEREAAGRLFSGSVGCGDRCDGER